MFDIPSDLSKTVEALKGLEEAIRLLDGRILAKKTDVEKRERVNQKELEEKTKNLTELKTVSEKIVSNIDEIINKLSGVL